MEQPLEPHLNVFYSLIDPEIPDPVRFVPLHPDVPRSSSLARGARGRGRALGAREGPGKRSHAGAPLVIQTVGREVPNTKLSPSRPSKARFLLSPVRAQIWLVLPGRTEPSRGRLLSVRFAPVPLSPRDQSGSSPAVARLQPRLPLTARLSSSLPRAPRGGIRGCAVAIAAQGGKGEPRRRAGGRR